MLNEFGLKGCRPVLVYGRVTGVATHRDPATDKIWVEFPDFPNLDGCWYDPSKLKYLD